MAAETAADESGAPTLVVVRTRPLGRGGAISVRADGRTLTCAPPDAPGLDFEFDAVLDERAAQRDVYALVRPVVASVLAGFDATLLAYGQSGSGKTYTIFGEGENAGVVPRAAAELAAGAAAAAAAAGGTFALSLAAVECYNERLICLLNPAAADLQVFHDAARGVQVPGLTWAPAADAAACCALAARALEARAVGATGMNAASSRSHCVVLLRVEQTAAAGGATRAATLRLVDLAGSERAARTGGTGAVLAEGCAINRSLLALGSVVGALAEAHAKGGAAGAAPRVPWRDSKLTRLLQGALGGGARAAVIVCASPAAADAHETLAALRFGARARGVEGAARPNAAADSPGAGAAALAAARAEAAELARRLAGALAAAPRAGPWLAAAAAQLAGLAAFAALERARPCACA
jgi:kinesin family protein 5